MDQEPLALGCDAYGLAKYVTLRYIRLLHESLPVDVSGRFLKRQLREDLDVADAV